ncbi:putative secreted FAD-linked oxidase [Streptomyces himastatinicus ATCC 53653]|uniref:Putative secreted FAD-linked oxidase n=2 Tax=Streptomyces violaceusniger group TaxID=2839105 RepID=D9WNW9_9ACTN|nr:putative secreted FAD-linked oxidase [Streptomyces himastatinicus ATCC 53653]
MERRRFLYGGASVGGGMLLGGTAGTAAAATTRDATTRAAAAGDAVAITPGDRNYADVVRGWNQRYIGKPEKVHLVTTTDQVVKVTQQAVKEGKRLAVRSGGHCFEDFVYHPDAKVVVDLSEMRQVDFDTERNAFMVESGCQLLDVYEGLYRRWGVVIPAGICHQVGAGGHVSGGGWGMLCRLLGLVVDHLYAVEVVVVDASGTARAVVATREESDPNRDLWWAHTGGGGGNFGIVTRYWFRSPDAKGSEPSTLLPRPPAEVLINAVSWPWSSLSRKDFDTLVKNYGAWHVAHSAPGDPYAGMCSYLGLNHRSNGAIGMITQMDATVPNAEQKLADFVAAISKGVSVAHEAATTRTGELAAMPELVKPRRMPWLQATRYLGTSTLTLNDPTLKGDFKSAYMRANFPDSHLDALYKHLTSDAIDNPTASVQLSSFGGQVNAVAQDATASSHRSSAFKMSWMLYWTEAADEAKSLAWIRECYQEVYAETGGVPVPNDVTDGCYVNYPDIDLGDPKYNTSKVPWHDLYYKENYPKLQAVKKKYDPRNIFRHSQSVGLPD